MTYSLRLIGKQLLFLHNPQKKMIMKRIILVLVTLALFVGVSAGNQPVIANLDSATEAVIQSSEKLATSVKDSIILSKLTSEQIMQLEKTRLSNERERIESEAKEDMPLNGLGIVMICLFPFLFVAVVIYISTKHKSRESARKYELYMKSLEMGQTIPDNFFEEPNKSSVNSNLKRGILWSMVGIALVISFLIMGKNNALIAGILPAFVGFGYLLVHFLEKPKTDSTYVIDEQHR